jgi:hypothetical protein
MPMIGNNWGLTIANAIIAENPDLDENEQTTLSNAWKLICTAHVTYLAANTLVNTIVAGSCPTGDVTGTGVGGVT